MKLYFIYVTDTSCSILFYLPDLCATYVVISPATTSHFSARTYFFQKDNLDHLLHAETRCKSFNSAEE